MEDDSAVTMSTPLSRYRYVSLGAAFTAEAFGFVTAVVVREADASSAFTYLSVCLGILVGGIHGRRVGVTVTGDTVVVRNPFRTYRVPTSDIAGIRGGTTLYVSGGWAPALTVRDRRKPLVLVGLLIPAHRFDRRSRWRPRPPWATRFDTAPGLTYKHADRFEPLAAMVAVNQIPVSREWLPLIGRTAHSWPYPGG